MQAIDVTVAFLSAGQVLVVRQQKPTSTIASFLKPFDGYLWFSIAATVFGQAIFQWVVARLSPVGSYRRKSNRARKGVIPSKLTSWMSGKYFVASSVDGAHKYTSDQAAYMLAWADSFFWDLEPSRTGDPWFGLFWLSGLVPQNPNKPETAFSIQWCDLSRLIKPQVQARICCSRRY